MKKKITAILMTAALMLTMAACAGNSTADTGVESSASSAVSSKSVSNTSSTAASSAKPSASAKPTANPCRYYGNGQAYRNTEAGE